MRNSRIESIEKLVIERKRIDLDALCTLFNVSKNTIRRDIDALCRKGNIKKVYGGVCAVDKEDLLPFDERSTRAGEAKKKIAAAAAGLIEDGDIIFVDSGTTTRPMVECMRARSHVTVLTASLDFIAASLPCENVNIISLSGALNRTTRSFVGDMAARTLERFNINKAFMASTGVTLEKGVTNFYAEEFEIKTTAMRQSQKKFLLFDKMKIGVVSMRTYAVLEDFDGLVTDSPLPDEYGRHMALHGRTVTVAGE